MNKKQIRVAFKAMVENDDMYSVSVDTISRQLGMTEHHIKMLSNEMGYTSSCHDDTKYVGTKQGLNRYNHDKKNGTNPFHQTA